MYRFLFILLPLMAFGAGAKAQSAPNQMIQCEECSTLDQMKPKAIGAAALNGGSVRTVVFSLKHGILQTFEAMYIPQQNWIWANPIANRDEVEEAFAHMLNAYQLYSGIFISQQTIRGRIDDISNRTHDPVTISLNGEHDSAYGSFIYDVKSCMSSHVCAGNISPQLGELIGAERRLNSIGVTLFGSGGSVAWENLPPNIEIWLCNDNNDCALIEYQDGRWEYVESRAEGGRGKRYPKYGEDVNYTFVNSGEAGIFRRGLENGGARVLGHWNLMTVLACTTAGGVKVCEYVTIPY